MDIFWMLSISMLSISIRPNINRFRMQHPLSRTASPRSGCSSERLRREGFSRRLYFASFSCLPFICACKNREHSFHCAPCTGTNRPPGLSPLAQNVPGRTVPSGSHWAANPSGLITRHTLLIRRKASDRHPPCRCRQSRNSAPGHWPHWETERREGSVPDGCS